MATDAFVSGRAPASDATAADPASFALLPDGWQAASLIAFPNVSDEAFAGTIVAHAPDDAILFGTRTFLGQIAEAGSLGGRSGLARQCVAPTSIISALNDYRPPLAMGPVFIHAGLFREEIEMRVRAVWQAARTLAGYDIDHDVLADAVAVALTEDFTFEIGRRQAPLVLQSGFDVLPVDLLIEAGIDVSKMDVDGARAAWRSAAFAFHGGAPVAPTRELVAAHAQFLSDSDFTLLQNMHR
ncbi:MAG: hypothetical protein AAFV26_08230, partial [Pseudomonadota bacterium]